MGIPAPEPGLVLNYAYLWHDEHRAGQDEARKDRPCVIVSCAAREAGGTMTVAVLPFTHSAPVEQDSAVEVPPAIKRHLGLDDASSWIVVAEGNEFVWPGYDLRRVVRTTDYAFGFLPPRFFKKVLAAFNAFHESGGSRLTPRG